MRAAVLELVQAAETALERNRARLDDLNVFPVPDGDTGTNMLLTVRAVTDQPGTPGSKVGGPTVHPAGRASCTASQAASRSVMASLCDRGLTG